MWFSFFFYEGRRREKVGDGSVLLEPPQPCEMFPILAVLCLNDGEEGAMSLLLYLPRPSDCMLVNSAGIHHV